MRTKHISPAFKLGEMLVVIGIIALLISLLLPGLATSRESARSNHCQSNLRQLIMATMQYTDVHDGIFPPHKSTKSVPISFANESDTIVVSKPRWPTLLSSFIEGTFDFDKWRELSATLAKTDDEFVPVDNKVFLCPNAPERTTVRNLGRSEEHTSE